MGSLFIGDVTLVIAILGTLVGCVMTATYYQGYNIGECHFPKHQKDGNLNLNLEALKAMQNLIGQSFKTTDENLPHLPGEETYTYEIGVCSVPAGYKYEGASKAAGAIQYVPDSNTDKSPTIVGSLNQTELMGGRNWVSLEYEGGQGYGHHCASEGRRTILMMTCNPSESEGKMRIVEENNNKTADCFYLFELEHKSLCVEYSSGLSVGTIVIIVFLCLVAVYLIGGFLYQRFVVGAKGLEQIPNYHFWQDFGNLQADGCDLVCRCGRQKSNQTYRGVGDDQLNNSLDDEDFTTPSNHDDDLLPM